MMKLLMLSIWLVVMPTLVGCLWTRRMKGYSGNVLQAFFYGLFSLFALFELLAIPMVFLKRSLTLLSFSWVVLTGILALISIVKNKSFAKEREWLKGCRHKMTAVLAVAIICIGCQAAYVTVEEHVDEDDAFYLATSTTAVEKDSLYRYSPYTGKEYKKLPARYVLAAWPLFLAVLSKLSSLHPAVLAHSVLPGYMVLLAYLIYALIAARLYPGEKKKQALFLLFAVILLSFSGFSRYSAGTFLFVRSWQGKAVLAGVGLPALCYSAWCAMKEEQSLAWFGLICTVTAACMFTSMGVALSLILVGSGGLVWTLSRKNWKCLFAVGFSCFPALVVGVVYVFLR
ncbi:MAG: DUF6077 domain-containing protein [Lachnospiraceae bacterium]|nr:DUF6077 domain-containing protein [Lachnospiraceae bacterium]